MTMPAREVRDPKSQLRKTMGFWDVMLFNIAAVLGPRWIAAAGHNGTSSISLWVLAAVFFFVPGALVINELSSRFPEEGGIYAWARDAFGPFHGFVAGWPVISIRLLPYRMTRTISAPPIPRIPSSRPSTQTCMACRLRCLSRRRAMHCSAER